MPNKKHLDIGDLVFVQENGEMESYKVADYLPYFNTYLLRNCQYPLHTIQIHEKQIKRIDSLNAMVVFNEDSDDMMDAIDDLSHHPFCTMSDEELEALAPPIDESNQLDSHDQEEYGFLYNALNSNRSIIDVLLQFATSENSLNDAALLAMRDRAEEIGSYDIVDAIDTYLNKDGEL